MVNPERRWAASYLAHKEARRRLRHVAKVTVLILTVAMATLALSGHRVMPECLGGLVCFARDSGRY